MNIHDIESFKRGLLIIFVSGISVDGLQCVVNREWE